MEENQHNIILACVGTYMIVCIGVGIWAMRRTRSTNDFFMAGRNLGLLVTAFAIFSSTMSGFGFVGGPGLVYQMGMSSVWMVICSTMGFCLSAFLLSKRLRWIGELRNTISLPDAVAARYKSELSRFLSAIAIIAALLCVLFVLPALFVGQTSAVASAAARPPRRLDPATPAGVSYGPRDASG